MVVRTVVFDETILRCVREGGADTVLNLAAGLDARPWRLDLPPSLRWVDVDLPAISRYKSEMMQGETPRCRYEAVQADLTDAAQRDEVLARVGAESSRVLVVSEGLLIYLADEEAAALAEALHAQPSFQWWLADLASPALLQWMEKRWKSKVDMGAAHFRFAPAEGSRWFERHGWREVEWRGSLEEAFRLRRAPRSLWPWRLLGRFASAKRREEFRRFSGYVLLERT
jgi:methyltransferase (TIGR00027 family)